MSCLHNYGLVRVLNIHFGVTEVIWSRVSTRTLGHACTLKALFKVAVELKITAVLCYCQNVYLETGTWKYHPCAIG